MASLRCWFGTTLRSTSGSIASWIKTSTPLQQATRLSLGLVSPESATERPERSASAAFRRGVASDLLNVKVGLFWTALVPQFLPPGSGPLLPAAMAATMATLVFIGLAGYALLATRLRSALGHRGVSRGVNATIGALLVALAAKLAS